MLRRRRMSIVLVLLPLLLALSIVNFDQRVYTFPVPGGPKSNIPLAGSRNPENKSGRRNG
jgi:hypothetical protein